MNEVYIFIVGNRCVGPGEEWSVIWAVDEFDGQIELCDVPVSTGCLGSSDLDSEGDNNDSMLVMLV